MLSIIKMDKWINRFRNGGIMGILLFVFLFASDWNAYATSRPDIPVDEMGKLLIQDGGRKKPFDTYARENLVKLSGRTHWKDSNGSRWDALEVLTDMALGTNNWLDEKIIKVPYIPLKNELGLTHKEAFFSYNDLRGNPSVVQKISNLLNPNKKETHPAKLTTEAMILSRQLRQIEMLTSPGNYSWVPVSGGGMWLSVEEGADVYKEQLPKMTEIYDQMVFAYRAGDAALFTTSVDYFSTQLQTLVAPEIYPIQKLDKELFYNHLHPFRLAWIILIICFAAILFAEAGGRLYWCAIVFFGIAVALQIVGFVLRTLISGRAPVTNMYEVLVFMALGASFIAFIYELIYRQKVFVLAASAVGAITLILADNLPAVFDPSIQPLVPVLQSNWWLTIHVITITIGYAAFLQAMGIGHIAIWDYLFKPTEQETIDKLTKFNYRTMQIGVLFLAAGTLLGGLWAEKAWGRFWGWDPKETWALIALLLYLVVLHARYTKWIGSFGLNAASVLAFQGIIMAGYGVNYILGTGKHSYGFGIGGEMAVLCFVLIELTLVILAVIRYKQKRNKKIT